MIRIFPILAGMFLGVAPPVSHAGGLVQGGVDSAPAVSIEPRSGVEAESFAGSGETAWAEGYEGEMILGLDGNLYEAYHPATIVHIQQILRDRGLYAGPLNGVLDRPTMAAIYAFQEANYELQVCGVPTPRTRLLLQQGSHTS